MRHECPNRKWVLLTQDGYVSASDEERVDESSSEKSEDNEQVYVDGYALAANLKNLMVQHVPVEELSQEQWQLLPVLQ